MASPTRKGTPPQIGKQIAPLTGSGDAAQPPGGAGVGTYMNRGYGASPIIASNPVNSGERAVGGANEASPVFPDVYRGGAQVTKRPKPPVARGQSASGAQGAF